MSEIQQALSKDDPRMVAWELYKRSDAYANSFKWAAGEHYREGSMWAAFLEGFNRAIAAARQSEGGDDKVSEWEITPPDLPGLLRAREIYNRWAATIGGDRYPELLDAAIIDARKSEGGGDKPPEKIGDGGPIKALKAAGDFIENLQDRLGATFGRDILKTIDAALAGHEGIARNRDDLILKGLRASCADVCSYATSDVPSSGCAGKCKRELNDFLDDDIRNMRAVVDALEVEHVEADIAMIELLKHAQRRRDHD